MKALQVELDISRINRILSHIKCNQDVLDPDAMEYPNKELAEELRWSVEALCNKIEHG